MAQTAGWIRTADVTEPVEATAVVHGEHCRKTGELFTEWSRALGFARHFGRNWDAFADSLTETVLLYPETEPARSPTTILVDQAGQLLTDEPDTQWTAFLGAARDASTVRTDDEDAASYRAGDPRLILVLRDSPEHLRPVTDRLTALGYAPRPTTRPDP